MNLDMEGIVALGRFRATFPGFAEWGQESGVLFRVKKFKTS